MFKSGTLIAEGKTKKIFDVKGVGDGPDLCIVEPKDDITAGDGAKHDIIQDKALLANTTTCNVFRLLKACGIPVAFVEQQGPAQFVAYRCEMIPLEVVCRREAHGSFLKRKTSLEKGTLFPRIVFELFLKTTGQKFCGSDLPWDDPLIGRISGNRGFLLFDPKSPNTPEPLSVTAVDVGPGFHKLEEIEVITRKVFLILEKAWQLLGRRLVDFKLEFGFDSEGTLLLSDVVDNDSWRVMEGTMHLDKQAYRDGEQLDTIIDRYHLVAELTGRFGIPSQQVILWTGSEKDDRAPFETAFKPFMNVAKMPFVVCSMHKEPERGIRELRKLVQEVPDSVVVVYVGRSNGAGPTLSAHTHIPVITVPAGIKSTPYDVWSSLRTPSDTPCITVLEPANAMLAVLQILAMRNPAIYAELRYRQEQRFVNTVSL